MLSVRFDSVTLYCPVLTASLRTDDGYRLTYGGLDYLALHTHRLRTTLSSLGNQIGVGKESDIYITASPQNRQCVLNHVVLEAFSAPSC